MKSLKLALVVCLLAGSAFSATQIAQAEEDRGAVFVMTNAANGNHIEHWLNGEKVVSYEIGSKEWLVHVKTSKFIDSKIYGRAPKGRLCLQDYRFPIELRNIKIRPLSAPSK